MSSHLQLLTPEIVADISESLSLERRSVENTLKLLLDDCTVPFIARYRKEATGGLDEVQIRNIRDKFEYLVTLNERREAILKSIEEQGKLTPELKARILACKVKTELEDLYLPYKPKKRSRAQIAKERGLEPLALAIYEQSPTCDDLVALATPYVGQHPEVQTLEVALQGARDYIAELIAETAEVRGEIRQWMHDNAVFRSVVKDDYKDKPTKYNNYYDFSEPVKSIAAHRLMALRRGEKEEILKVTLEYDESLPLQLIAQRVIRPTATEPVRVFLTEAIADAFRRLLAPSIETELRLETKNRAEEEAIRVFAANLRKLLLLPPIPQCMVLGIDPGLRTGSKLVVVDQTGKLLEYTTIYPEHDVDFNDSKNLHAAEKLLDLVEKYRVTYIAVGNGTACREMEAFVEKALESKGLEKSVKVVVVNESGASVYSASDIAREEFPDLDITYRGAVSIARRLQDPLAEFVKIDPKSIGVGQYQHDVNQTRLKKALEEVVESCVNYVGVHLNTASPSLLSYVSGIGPTLAKNIVKYRDTYGVFKSRDALMNVMGFGPKTFEQAAGFLRIPESENPLDNSAVHPEAYPIVEKMASDLGVSLRELVGNKELVEKIKIENYVTEDIGIPTLQDIIQELLKPGRDPREDGFKHTYNRDIRNFDDLKEGQIVEGTVTNVTNFGAFVDIGVHQDGLIHISELSAAFVKNPSEVIAVGDKVKVKIIGIDRERRRISLSKKAVEDSQGQHKDKKRPAAATRKDDADASSAEQRKQGAQRGEACSQKLVSQESRKHHAASKNEPSGKKGSRSSSERNSKDKTPASESALQDLIAKFNSNRL